MHSLTVAVSMAIKQQVNTDKQAKKESEMTHSKQLRILHIYEIYIYAWLAIWKNIIYVYKHDN